LILIVLALTVFEGALRKWVFYGSPSLRYATYISKDVVFLLAGMAGVALIPLGQRRLANKLLLSALLLVPPVLVNLPNTSIAGAVLSLRAYVLLPLWAIWAAGGIRSFKQIDRAILAVGVFTIVVAGIGLVQFRLPPGHFLNRYDLKLGQVTAQFGHIRATGTFAYISGMAVMSAAGAWAATYLYLSASGPFRRLLALAVGLAAISCSLVAMTRGGLIVCLFNIVGGVACCRRAKGLIFVGLLGLVVWWMLGGTTSRQSMEETAAGATMRRFNEGERVLERIEYDLDNLYEGVSTWPLGIGLGAGQVGAAVAEQENFRGLHTLENEKGRIIYEVGILGFLAVYLIRILVLAKLFPIMLRCEDLKRRALYSASFVMILTSFLVNMSFNHTSSSMAWCVVALTFAALNVKSDENEPRSTPGMSAPMVRTSGGR
jgi:hypothetical protein